MKRTIGLLSFALLGVNPLLAGALFEIETTHHRESAPRIETAEVMAEGLNLRMQVPSPDPRQAGEIIFHGDSRELIVIDHAQRSYFVIDRASLEKISAQLDSATSQMEAALENVPAEQRAMMEKMMKSRMPAAAAKEPAPTELKQTAERETKNGYPCVKYEVLRDGEKISELWVTNWGNIDGGDELARAFEGMSDLFREFSETASRATGKLGGLRPQIDASPFGHVKAMKGFPVLTREFENENVGSESALRSAKLQDFDPGAFDPPARYKRRKMFEQH